MAADPLLYLACGQSVMAMDNFYSVTVYNKGAEVIRMYRTLLGWETFRKGMDLYFARHDGEAVTCDDFRKAMADASGRDLTQFERWYLQAGTPTVTASSAYDAASQTYSLTLSQSTPPTPGQPTKLPFHIPVEVGLLGADGSLLRSATLEVCTLASEPPTHARGWAFGDWWGGASSVLWLTSPALEPFGSHPSLRAVCPPSPSRSKPLAPSPSLQAPRSKPLAPSLSLPAPHFEPFAWTAD